jgi:hypothetical protein
MIYQPLAKRFYETYRMQNPEATLRIQSINNINFKYIIYIYIFNLFYLDQMRSYTPARQTFEFTWTMAQQALRSAKAKIKQTKKK